MRYRVIAREKSPTVLCGLLLALAGCDHSSVSGLGVVAVAAQGSVESVNAANPEVPHRARLQRGCRVFIVHPVDGLQRGRTATVTAASPSGYEVVSYDQLYSVPHESVATPFEVLDLCAKQAIRMDPESLYLRAGALSMLGNREEAIKDLDTAITLSPKEAHFYLRRGVYLGKSGNRTAAIKDFSTAIKLNPTWGVLWYKRAFAQSSEDINAALADATNAVARSNSALTLNAQGYMYYLAEDYERAIEVLEQATRSDHADLISYRNLALAHAKKEDWAAAVDSYLSYVVWNFDRLRTDASLYDYWVTKCLTDEPDHLGARVLKAIRDRNDGEWFTYKESLDAIANRQSFNSQSNDACVLLIQRLTGELHLKTANFQEAVANFSKLAAHPRADSNLLLDLAEAQRGLQDIAAATQAYKRSVQLNAKTTRAWYFLGKFHLESSPDLALLYFDRAVNLEPEDHLSRLRRGELHLLRGDAAAAVKDLQIARRTAPSDTETLEAYAWAHAAAVRPEVLSEFPVDFAIRDRENPDPIAQRIGSVFQLLSQSSRVVKAIEDRGENLAAIFKLSRIGGFVEEAVWLLPAPELANWCIQNTDKRRVSADDLFDKQTGLFNLDQLELREQNLVRSLHEQIKTFLTNVEMSDAELDAMLARHVRFPLALQESYERKLESSEAAYRNVESLVEQSPDCFPLLILAGDLARSSQDFESAHRYYLKATEVNPEASLAKIRLAIALTDLGDLDAGWSTLSSVEHTVADTHPTVPSVEVLLARAEYLNIQPTNDLIFLRNRNLNLPQPVTPQDWRAVIEQDERTAEMLMAAVDTKNAASRAANRAWQMQCRINPDDGVAIQRILDAIITIRDSGWK